MKSADSAQPRLKKQTSPFPNSLRAHSKQKTTSKDSPSNPSTQDLLDSLGVSGDYFQTLFGNLSEVFVFLGKVVFLNGAAADLILLDASPSCKQLFGNDAHRIIRRKLSELHDFSSGIPQWVNMLGSVATSGIEKTIEFYHEETEKYIQTYLCSPKRGYVVAICVDVTERKKSEQELNFAEKKYRRLYETTQDGIMARDVNGQMIDCNRAYAKMLGYTRKELKRLVVKQLMPEKWHQQREEIAAKVLQTGHSIVFEREYTRKDGTVFPASVRTWRLTDGKGKAIGIWSIVRDISEQKAYERNLEEQTQSLERTVEERTKQLKDSERLAAIGQTAGMVGHDLRNPLQTVLGELYLAKIEVESLSESEPKSSLLESIRVIEEQAAYMDKIVSDLQAFVRPVKIDKKPINLKELITAVVASIVIPANVEVHKQMQDDFPQIKADIQLVKRVLINLVTNAVQAMPNGGELTLEAQAYPEGSVSITVKDTGVGIAENIKPKIFTPLFTTKPRGQGFGLAVCKRVIEAHGGAISFESQEGKGAEFTIQLPPT